MRFPLGTNPQSSSPTTSLRDSGSPSLRARFADVPVFVPTLVCSAITADKKFQRALVDATHIDRLNIGPIPTIQLNWLQPHEGSIVDFLFRARAFQFDKDMVAV